MASVSRTALAWVLAFFMPFQALTTVYLDVRGPAHFHADEGARHGLHDDAAVGSEHEHGRTHEYSHVLETMGLQAAGGHLHSRSHGGNAVERHHHHPGDNSVVTSDEHGLPGDFALREEATSGWSGAMLVTLPSGGPLLQSPDGLDVPAPWLEPLLQTRSVGRLERPPRIIPA